MFFVPLDQAVVMADVVEVKQVSHFAGKLGRRVSSELVVRHNNQTFEIKWPTYHTRIAGKSAPKAGDRIRVSANQLSRV